MSSELEALQEHGWVWFEISAGGVDSVILTQAGIHIANEFTILRTNSRRRLREMRDVLLNFGVGPAGPPRAEHLVVLIHVLKGVRLDDHLRRRRIPAQADHAAAELFLHRLETLTVHELEGSARRDGASTTYSPHLWSSRIPGA